MFLRSVEQETALQVGKARRRAAVVQSEGRCNWLSSSAQDATRVGIFLTPEKVICWGCFTICSFQVGSLSLAVALTACRICQKVVLRVFGGRKRILFSLESATRVFLLPNPSLPVDLPLDYLLFIPLTTPCRPSLFDTVGM
jgi:hypothetical protein